MATANQNIPYHTVDGARAVVNLSTSLTEDSVYRFEAQGAPIRLHEGASAPDPDDVAAPPAYMTLNPGEVYFHSQGSENLYAWTVNEAGGNISRNDAE